MRFRHPNHKKMDMAPPGRCVVFQIRENQTHPTFHGRPRPPAKSLRTGLNVPPGEGAGGGLQAEGLWRLNDLPRRHRTDAQPLEGLLPHRLPEGLKGGHVVVFRPGHAVDMGDRQVHAILVRAVVAGSPGQHPAEDAVVVLHAPLLP